RDAGRPLDAELRADMEARFEASFADVRLHLGPAADASAQAVNARAYTVGPDIVFARGEFAPASPAGRRLIAHELAHVIQQRRGGVAVAAPLPDGVLEQDATRAAAAAAGGAVGPVAVAGVSATGVARETRSPRASVNPQTLSDQELEHETRLIKEWL